MHVSNMCSMQPRHHTSLQLCLIDSAVHHQSMLHPSSKTLRSDTVLSAQQMGWSRTKMSWLLGQTSHSCAQSPTEQASRQQFPQFLSSECHHTNKRAATGANSGLVQSRLCMQSVTYAMRHTNQLASVSLNSSSQLRTTLSTAMSDKVVKRPNRS